MFKSGQPLLHPADFDNAVLFLVPVEVWQDGHLIDYGGPIVAHTDTAVEINGGFFLKSMCQFKFR